MARTWKTETYIVTDKWLQQIVKWSDLEPTIDAFASRGNNRLPDYWTKSDDAFQHDWSRDVLWMNPPFSRMESVLQKILTEGHEAY